MASSPTRHRIKLHKVRKCETQKTGYPTKSAALDACERLMELGRVSPGCHLTPYECDECHEWHLYNRVIVETEPIRRPWLRDLYARKERR